MNQQEVKTVLVVDDHVITREGLASIINRQPDLRVAGEAGSGEEAIEIFGRIRPDVTLMDLRLRGMDGIEAARRICTQSRRSQIIMLTTFEGDEDIYRALEAGVRGYLLKDSPREELLSAIRMVAGGGRFIPARVSAFLAERIPGSSLSSRELDVLRLIVGGNSNKEIAWLLDIAEGTVKAHVNNILGKMQAKDRTHAAVTAIRRGVVRLFGARPGALPCDHRA